MTMSATRHLCRFRRLTAATVLVVGAAGVCGIAGATGVSATPVPNPDGPGPVPTTTNDHHDRLPRGSEPVNLKPEDFTLNIDNPYWPMKPGTHWTFSEVDHDGQVFKVDIIVTPTIKTFANGIKAREVRDTVTLDGAVVEDTKDWYAQDDDGNIWYFGEDTAEFENGTVVSREGSFQAYVDGALPGVVVAGKPRAGVRYREEYYKGHAEDNAEVLSTHELVEVPYGKFRNALLTRNTVTIKPDVQEFKLYAKGVGPVMVLGVSGGSGAREELVTIDTVAPTAGTGPLGQP